MKFSKMFIKTYKESPSDAEVISHKLMTRASMIKKLASGVYSYLPLGYKSLKKVENIVREEMNKAGAQEIVMPVLAPADLWKESGRWSVMGPELMRLQDRNEVDFCLSPTHEEVITDIIRNEIASYKQLPINLYQIQTKFRDERRPRFGLMRTREFLMKDAYSFHISEESLDEEYNNMKLAYRNIFDRIGLNYRPVEADGGPMGDNETEEFHVLAQSGEDLIIYCDKCEYAANSEKAISKKEFGVDESNTLNLEEVNTPNQKTIDDIAKFFEVSKEKTLKALIYKSKSEDKTLYFMALIRGDQVINEVKLKNLLGVSNPLELIDDRDFEKLNLEKGFIGPIGVNTDLIQLVGDYSIKNMKNFIIGANKKDFHYKNANIDIDFKLDLIGDIRTIEIGEKCTKCSDGILSSARGIEVGQVFKLGEKYSKSLNAKVLDNNGKEQFITMGCYGIGVGRTLAASIEQNHDEFGIIWPRAIAPFEVNIIIANAKNADQLEYGEKLYELLKSEGFDVCLDDRKERAGVKFKDADLIGIPIKVVVGKGISEDLVEVKLRKNNEKYEVKSNELIDLLTNQLKNL